MAALVRDRKVSSRDLVEAHLARIEAVNPIVNAITVVLADTALAAADAADAATVSGATLGRFHGVPFTVKENIDLVGSATTNGLVSRIDALPPLDAPMVERMKAAGAVPIARTNQPELALRIDTGNALRGRTCNPWALDRTPGGSSGGEAAAHATGMSPFGLGNDIGGSLRNPAYCCGTTALRPTMGRVPSAMSLAPYDGGLSGQLMATGGPMARHVADLRTGLEVLGGRHHRSPTSCDVAIDLGPPVNRRVGVVTTGFTGALPPTTRHAVGLAAGALADAGWEVVPIDFPELAFVSEIWMRVLCEDIELTVEAVIGLVDDQLLQVLADHLVQYDRSAMPHQQIYVERHRLMRVWSEMFLDTPIVLSPMWPDVPFIHGADLEGGVQFISDTLQFASPGPLLGIPGCAVPVGEIDGFAGGVQIQADRWRDDLVLDAAAAIEAAVGVITPIDPHRVTSVASFSFWSPVVAPVCDHA